MNVWDPGDAPRPRHRSAAMLLAGLLAVDLLIVVAIAYAAALILRWALGA